MSETKFLPIVQPQNNTVFEAFAGAIQHGCDLDIAIDRFSLYAFEALKSKLRDVTKLRLLYAHPCFEASSIDDTALLGSVAERPKAKALVQAILARDFAAFLQAKSQIKACNAPNPGIKRIDIRHKNVFFYISLKSVTTIFFQESRLIFQFCFCYQFTDIVIARIDQHNDVNNDNS